MLFTGDSVWNNKGTWEAVVLGESDPSAYAASLELMAELRPDAVIPWAAWEDAPAVEIVDPDEWAREVRNVAAR